MDETTFNNHFNTTLEELENLIVDKSVEYVVGKNKFHNFDRAAVIQKLSREQIMLNYSMKHFISIIDMIDKLPQNYPNKEKVVEKFNDLITYLILMKISLINKLQQKETINGC